VLVELEVVVHSLAIRTFHSGCQAPFTEAHLICAVLHIWDLAATIKFGIVLEVERFVAHWGAAIIAACAHGGLVVNVKVLSAALFANTICATTTMSGHNCWAIRVTLVVLVPHVILVMGMAEFVRWTWCKPFFRLGMDFIAKHFGPLAIVVNLFANLATLGVVLLARLVDAILISALADEFFLGIIMEEDIHVAFDLLGGRPIDLAVLLQTILRPHLILVLIPAHRHAGVLLDAGSELATISATLAPLKLPLSNVTVIVDVKVLVVRLLTGSMLFHPILITVLKSLNHGVQPFSKFGILSTVTFAFGALHHAFSRVRILDAVSIAVKHLLRLGA
jgi:hypothetical protein